MVCLTIILPTLLFGLTRVALFECLVSDKKKVHNFDRDQLWIWYYSVIDLKRGRNRRQNINFFKPTNFLLIALLWNHIYWDISVQSKEIYNKCVMCLLCMTPHIFPKHGTNVTNVALRTEFSVPHQTLQPNFCHTWVRWVK